MQLSSKMNTFIIMICYLIISSPFIVLFSNNTFEMLSISTYIWLIGYLITVLQLVFFNSSIVEETDSVDKEQLKIVAIVCAYNEKNVAVQMTVDAILEQTYSISKIIVIDDGSKNPIHLVKNNRVKLIRQKNNGKRFAQVAALKQLENYDYDLILTVDSDSIIEKNAVKKMICRFQKDQEVYAITGLVVTSNFRKNILTRIVDLNIGASCIAARPIRSYFGALETTSGALSMYKKEVLCSNIDDYLSSGTYSDDRQLCFYANLKGKTIGLTNVVVESHMPESMSSTYKQRLRWGKGSWKFFPKQLRYLNFTKLTFPILSMTQVFLIIPLYLFILYCLFHTKFEFLYIYFFIRYMVRLSQILMYCFYHPMMTMTEKILSLVLLTPFEIIFSTFFLPYIKFKSLFFLKDNNWFTR